MANPTIKIPSKHYVGMVQRGNEKLPLAFITPNGEDAASLKRIDTVNDWVAGNGRYGGNKALPSMVIDNVPLSGFKLTTDIRSSSYGGLDKWRIEDPRGFELEITSGNLARLLSVGMIDRGEINDQCVWGRDGANNVLISVNTDEYKVAVENTKVAGLKADWKAAKPGNTVLLQNNVRGVWLGRMHMLTRDRASSQTSAIGCNELSSGNKSLHVIFVDTPPSYGKETSQLLLISSPKLAAIEDDTAITEAEAERRANELIASGTCAVNANGYKTVIALTFGNVQPAKNITLSLRPVDIVDEAELLRITHDYNRRDHVFATDADGNFGRIGRRYEHGKNNVMGLECYDLGSIGSGEFRAVNILKQNDGYWGRSSSTWNHKGVPHEFTAGIYQQLVASIKTKSGNIIEALL